MRSVMITMAVCGIFAMLVPHYSEAEQDAIPCTAEPTDMTIHYGDRINCTLGPTGADRDTFRFVGRAGENVVLILTNFSHPIEGCIELYRPPPPVSTGSLLEKSCSTYPSRLGAPSVVLPVSGTYMVLVYDLERDETSQYSLILERVDPPPSSAPLICYNQPPIETERIDSPGDLDVFTFDAKVDDQLEITVVNLGPFLLEYPCAELFAPDGTQVMTACGAQPPPLTQAGRYTILISDSGYDQVGPYALTLLCTSGPCAICPECKCGVLDGTICGTENDDTLMGTAGNDVIVGKAGNDLIYGRGGNDIICGGAGNDIIFGGTGDDQLFGGLDADALFGEAGNDRLFGEGGRDVLYGGPGLDRLSGGAGNDLLFGGVGSDTLNGGSGNDICDDIDDTIAALSCEIRLNP
jgi:RTX calcium-binding nonapeptide repeat (4 copies)